MREEAIKEAFARQEEVAGAFRPVMGGDAVETGEAVWRFACNGVVPSCVVRPRTVAAAQSAVRAAGAAGLAVVASGSATHLGIGFPPRRYDAALCLRGVDRLITHEPGDMSVTAEAGMTMRALNERVGRAGQWLPYGPAPSEEATLGGVIAADRNGPFRLAHGKVRDWLTAVTVVLADGTIIRCGAGTGVHADGCDLRKLFTGSYGTLGVIVEATLRLQPRPACERLFVAGAASIEAAVEHGLALRDSAVGPVLLEALNETAAVMVGVASTAAVVIGCAGSEAEVAEQERRLGEIAGIQCVPEGERTALQRALCSFPEPLSEDALVARVSTRPAALGALLKRFETEARTRRLTLEIAAHAGSGVAWCQLAGPLPMPEFERCAEWMRLHTREQQGWVVFESLPPGLEGRVDPWGFNAPSLRLMAGVKQALDPGELFSPGRFVGKI